MAVEPEPELAVDYSEFEKEQICPALVAEQRLLDDSVLQDTGLRASKLLVSDMKNHFA